MVNLLKEKAKVKWEQKKRTNYLVNYQLQGSTLGPPKISGAWFSGVSLRHTDGLRTREGEVRIAGTSGGTAAYPLWSPPKPLPWCCTLWPSRASGHTPHPPALRGFVDDRCTWRTSFAPSASASSL